MAYKSLCKPIIADLKYKQLITECMCLFDKKHGENHDKFVYSQEIYKKLCSILSKKEQFEFSDTGSLFYKYGEGPGGILFCSIVNGVYETILIDVEMCIVKPLYKKILKNKLLQNRVNKLKSITPISEYKFIDERSCDIKYMELFIQYALKNKLTDNDYIEFDKLIIIHYKEKENREKMNCVLDMSVCMLSVCTIC